MFVVPKPEGDKKENRFEFKIGTVKHSVPFIQFLGGQAAQYLEDYQTTKSYVGLFRELLIIEAPDCSADVRSLSIDQMSALVDAWNEASNATVGESSASDES